MDKDILVVDDDASGRAMLCLSLRQAGFRVRGAAGGAEALRLLQERPSDVLITDAKMQPMDGFELTERAKKLRPGLQVAMMSAICTELDCRGRPIDKCFPKPISIDELVGWISNLIP